MRELKWRTNIKGRRRYKWTAASTTPQTEPERHLPYRVHGQTHERLCSLACARIFLDICTNLFFVKHLLFLKNLSRFLTWEFRKTLQRIVHRFFRKKVFQNFRRRKELEGSVNYMTRFIVWMFIFQCFTPRCRFVEVYKTYFGNSLALCRLPYPPQESVRTFRFCCFAQGENLLRIRLRKPAPSLTL